MRPLARKMRVIAPDLMGYGYTERRDGIDYGLDAWGMHFTGLLDALGLEQIDLVGNSKGAAVASAFAIGHPDRMRSLVCATPGIDGQRRGANRTHWRSGRCSGLYAVARKHAPHHGQLCVGSRASQR